MFILELWALDMKIAKYIGAISFFVNCAYLFMV